MFCKNGPHLTRVICQSQSKRDNLAREISFPAVLQVAKTTGEWAQAPTLGERYKPCLRQRRADVVRSLHCSSGHGGEQIPAYTKTLRIYQEDM